MSFNKTKVLEDIQKYIQKGQIDKAIEEYERVLRIDPKDYKIRQKLGDLYLRKGKKNEAINQYLNVADIYIKDGFYLKAIAIYRQILRTDPQKLDIYEKLAELYKKQGLNVDAISQLRALAEIYEKQKNLQEAIATWEKIISYDPENIFYRGKIVEFYLKQGLASRAAEKLEQSIDYLKSKGRMEDVERLMSHFPGIIQEDKELSVKIINSLYESGKYNDAIQKIDSVLKQNPRDANLYAIKGHCYFNLGNVNLAKICFENALKIKSNHIEAQKGMAKIFSREKDFVSLIVVLEEIYNNLKVEKRYDEIKSILDNYFPYLAEEEKILKLYLDLSRLVNNQQMLIEYLKRTAKLYLKKGREEDAEKVFREIIDLDPYEESAVKYFEEKKQKNIEITPISPTAPPATTREERAERITEDIFKEDRDVQKEVDEVSFLLKYGLLSNAKQKLDELKGRFPDSPLVKEKWAEYFDKTKDYPALKMVYGELVSIYGSLENDDKVKFYSQKIEEVNKKLESLDKLGEASEAIETLEEPELIEEIEEIEIESLHPNLDDLMLELEYRLSNNDMDEAERLCNEILSIDKENVRASEILQKIKLMRSKEIEQADQKEIKEEPVKELKEEQKEDFFDLTSEIMKELEKEEEIKSPFKDESERITFENLFKEFKNKLSQQIGKEDVETHYNLGIAYKEMGLYDDAIGEFFLTSEFEDKMYDSYIMIATCFTEKGDLEKAALFYKKALAMDNISDEKKAGTYFELGNIYEREKNVKKAYYCYKMAISLDFNLKIAQNKIEDMIKINPELSKEQEIEI